MRGRHGGRARGAAISEGGGGHASRGEPGAGEPRTLFEGSDLDALDEVVTGEFSAHRLRVGVSVREMSPGTRDVCWRSSGTSP